MNIARANALMHNSTEETSRPFSLREQETQPEMRHRSGSWSGANESEDEIEAMHLERNHNQPINCNVAEHQSSVSQAEDKMRRKLRFFFMNPIEKWQAKRRFPYKFIVQLIKIFLVTAQLWWFAKSRYTHINYTWDNRIAFSHLFLRDWDPIREVDTYPPATGPMALYKVDEFFATIDYAVLGYANLTNAIGPYSYPTLDNSITPLELCMNKYKEGIIYGFNESYIFNSEIVEHCVNLTVAVNASDFSSAEFLSKRNHTVNFSALVSASLRFAVKTVNFKSAGPISPPDCYRFDIHIDFDNEDHDGQMMLTLDAEALRLYCNGVAEYTSDSLTGSILRSLMNCVVILICSLSLVLCSRAIYRAQQLKWETVRFFKNYYGKDLSSQGCWQFVNFWYIMIIANDILIILGSAIKEEIERKHFVGDQWNICSLLLGTGNLLVWFGVLRYLGFFKTYNVLILTLQRAAPRVARFSLCALIIYAGFTFCGWLILGPYHMKFRSLSTTSECLFSLINGDDMFATFSIMSDKSMMLWWFCRIYLYSFIALFIYVVLSLFISLIMDAYETIKCFYQEGFPKSDLMEFVSQCTEPASSDRYRTDSFTNDPSDLLKCLWCCRKYAEKFYNRFFGAAKPSKYFSLKSFDNILH
ncbi:mucolipin-3-like isoform X2 [Neocloeon triangulifer]|uniref:mucolipin-3-like isoform X2 n=1 Tax=Neocloeon triangulifer TaxID=2078957 RepID=UPI00286F3289|nr:mucolipin-3-like isoform X2 [Neocloeon triangulifer]